jgi:cytoskeleton protein RodZ
MSALGVTFRTARESRGFTLSDAAERTHIRSVYLEAIEAEDWDTIGPPVYVRGFVRTYARLLGLDCDAALAGLSADAGDIPAAAVVQAAAPRVEPLLSDRGNAGKRGLSVGAVAAVLVAFALVLFVGFQYVDYQRGQTVPGKSVPARPTAQPQRAMRDVPAAIPAAARAELHPADRNGSRPSGFAVRLRDSSWLRIVVDGKVEMEGVYPSGTQRTFSGRSATVRVGNAGGVDIAVDGKDLGPMGGLGDVAERSYQR